MKSRDLWEKFIEDNPNRVARSSSYMEQGVVDESMAKEETARFNGPVSINVLSRRYRFTDSDGLCKKYLIDALVSCGLLPDDSPEYLPEEPISRQEKISKKEREETIITIREL